MLGTGQRMVARKDCLRGSGGTVSCKGQNVWIFGVVGDVNSQSWPTWVNSLGKKGKKEKKRKKEKGKQEHKSPVSVIRN